MVLSNDSRVTMDKIMPHIRSDSIYYFHERLLAFSRTLEWLSLPKYIIDTNIALEYLPEVVLAFKSTTNIDVMKKFSMLLGVLHRYNMTSFMSTRELTSITILSEMIDKYSIPGLDFDFKNFTHHYSTTSILVPFINGDMSNIDMELLKSMFKFETFDLYMLLYINRNIDGENAEKFVNTILELLSHDTYILKTVLHDPMASWIIDGNEHFQYMKTVLELSMGC